VLFIIQLGHYDGFGLCWQHMKNLAFILSLFVCSVASAEESAQFKNILKEMSIQNSCKAALIEFYQSGKNFSHPEVTRRLERIEDFDRMRSGPLEFFYYTNEDFSDATPVQVFKALKLKGQLMTLATEPFSSKNEGSHLLSFHVRKGTQVLTLMNSDSLMDTDYLREIKKQFHQCDYDILERLTLEDSGVDLIEVPSAEKDNPKFVALNLTSISDYDYFSWGWRKRFRTHLKNMNNTVKTLN